MHALVTSRVPCELQASSTTLTGGGQVKYLVEVETKLRIAWFDPRQSSGAHDICPSNEPPVICPVNSYWITPEATVGLPTAPKYTVPPLNIPDHVSVHGAPNDEHPAP